MLKDTTAQYGWVTIVIHWLMAAVILGLFTLGWYMVDLTYYDSLYRTLPFIHKSVGILLAGIFLFRFVWKIINPSTKPVPGTSPLEQLAAKLVHWLFYLLITLTVVSGYLISTADNSSISVFDIFRVPATITGIPEQEDNAGLVHEILAYILMAMVVLHAAAALKHHFINRDQTLRRMLGRKSR